jgi:hypothetical protein
MRVLLSNLAVDEVLGDTARHLNLEGLKEADRATFIDLVQEVRRQGVRREPMTVLQPASITPEPTKMCCCRNLGYRMRSAFFSK